MVADNDGSGQPAATDYVCEAYEIQGRGISRYEMITKENTAELSADGKGVETRAVAIELSAVEESIPYGKAELLAEIPGRPNDAERVSQAQLRNRYP
jgi:hypothetical protein